MGGLVSVAQRPEEVYKRDGEIEQLKTKLAKAEREMQEREARHEALVKSLEQGDCCPVIALCLRIVSSSSASYFYSRSYLYSRRRRHYHRRLFLQDRFRVKGGLTRMGGCLLPNTAASADSAVLTAIARESPASYQKACRGIFGALCG